jgi:hypothetical protein
MIPACGDEKFPEKESSTFNANEPYWQLTLAHTACKMANDEATEEDRESVMDIESGPEKSHGDSFKNSGRETDLEEDIDDSSDNEDDWEDVSADGITEIRRGSPSRRGTER